MGYSNKQILQKLGLNPEDLDHASCSLLARLYPDAADAVYMVGMVLSLRQRDGAIAIPWPGDGASVTDLLAAHLAAIKSGLTAKNIRTAFAHLNRVKLIDLVRCGAVVRVDGTVKAVTGDDVAGTAALANSATGTTVSVDAAPASSASGYPRPGDSSTDADGVIILDGGRLYLRRFWRYELDVAAMVNSRSLPEALKSSDGFGEESSQNVNKHRSESLPESGGRSDDNALGSVQNGRESTEREPSARDQADLEQTGQDQAVQAGLTYRFAVITGGPGTGKTHSVLMLLTAMLTRRPDLRIVLCAPTGKAAARMMESIQANLERIRPPQHVRAAIPTAASTIHRLIRWNPARGKSVYDALNPLPYDVVILDEASMVDAALMARLARALRPETRLILLGDKDQLSSVEAGSVFADIASNQAPNVVRLTKSWRFDEHSEIGALARAINAGAGAAAWNLLEQGKAVTIAGPVRATGSAYRTASRDLTSSPPESRVGVGTAAEGDAAQKASHGFSKDDSTARGKEALYRRIRDGVEPLFTLLNGQEDHVQALGLLQRFQVLTALRVGPYGSVQINAAMDQQLSSGKEWYAGRPVMATANNYELEIYNGDIGLTRFIDGRLMVAFAGTEPDSVRWIAPAQLKSVSTAWALTVHKSQGSEYDNVLLVLPDKWSPVLSRELAYTALTRSRQVFAVWGTGELWTRMLASQVERFSGLADRLAQIPST